MKRTRTRTFLNELLIQLRKYVYCIVGALVLLLVCDTLCVLFESTFAVLAIASLVREIIWCFVACYLAFEMFRYGNGGDDYFLLTVPGGKRKGLSLKAFAFFVILTLITVVEYPFFVRSLARKASRSVVLRVSAYDFVSRLIGIIAFLMLLMVMTYLASIARSNVLAMVIAFGGYLVVCIAQICLVVLPKLLNQNVFGYGVGYRSDFVGAGWFVNIMPLMIWNQKLTGDDMMLSTISAPAVVSNVVLIAVFYVIWRFVCPHIRVNWIK